MADNEHPPPAAQQPEAAAPKPPAGQPDAAAGSPPPVATPAPPAARPPGPPPAAQPAGAGSTVPPAPPPAVRPPTEITPEQVRQFQEFQQFQELMRQQADHGLPAGAPPPGQLQPWGPPPPRQSPVRRFLKALAGKIVTAAVLLALLVAAGYFAIDYFFGDNRDQLPASQTGGGRTKDNRVLPTNPFEAVRQVYQQIAQNNGSDQTDEVCLSFTPEASEEFAQNLDYPNCQAAVLGLFEEVTDPNAYAKSMPRNRAAPPGETVRISSCADNIRGGIQGGRPLGAFTVEIIEGSVGGQWIITGHEREPDDCGGVTASTPPTN